MGYRQRDFCMQEKGLATELQTHIEQNLIHFEVNNA